MAVFCPTCGNMLLVELTEYSKELRYFCQACPYVYNIDKKISKKAKLVVKEVDDVLGGDEAWKNVAKTDGEVPALYLYSMHSLPARSGIYLVTLSWYRTRASTVPNYAVTVHELNTSHTRLPNPCALPLTHFSDVSQVRLPPSLFHGDPDSVSGRAGHNLLQVCVLCTPLEGGVAATVDRFFLFFFELSCQAAVPCAATLMPLSAPLTFDLKAGAHPCSPGRYPISPANPDVMNGLVFLLSALLAAA